MRVRPQGKVRLGHQAVAQEEQFQVYKSASGKFAGCMSAAAGEDAETVSSEVRTTNRANVLLLRCHFPGFVRTFIAIISIDVLFFLREILLDLGDQPG